MQAGGYYVMIDSLEVLTDTLPFREFHLQVFIVEEEGRLSYATLQLPVEPFHDGLGIIDYFFSQRASQSK